MQLQELLPLREHFRFARVAIVPADVSLRRDFLRAAQQVAREVHEAFLDRNLRFEANDFVREAAEKDLRDMDFWLEQPYDKWQEMLTNIKSNGAADLSHTLNTIDLSMPEGLARSHDGYRRDAFYRFNQSIQDFFNASAKIDTKFAEPSAVSA